MPSISMERNSTLSNAETEFRRWKCGHDSDFFTYTRKADQQDYTQGEVQYPEYTSLEV
jgi:hypothetical protein